jgi:hypothetical protein
MLVFWHRNRDQGDWETSETVLLGTFAFCVVHAATWLLMKDRKEATKAASVSPD